MKRIFLPIVAVAMVTACQNTNEQVDREAVEKSATIASSDVATKVHPDIYVGKYSLEDGCEDGKPVIELTANKLQWGETSCTIDSVSLTEEGLPLVEAKLCTAAGETQDDRSFTIEHGGMMSIEFTSGEETTIAKRCSAFDPG